MDKDEILKIAKEKYPVGTVFISPKSNIEFKIINHLSRISGGNLQFNVGSGEIPYVYYNGKWAEIISTPNKNYELW